MIGLIVVVLGVLVLLGPVSRRVIESWSFHGAFDTVRAGLILTDVLILTTGIAAGFLAVRLSRRIGFLESKL